MTPAGAAASPAADERLPTPLPLDRDPTGASRGERAVARWPLPAGAHAALESAAASWGLDVPWLLAGLWAELLLRASCLDAATVAVEGRDGTVAALRLVAAPDQALPERIDSARNAAGGSSPPSSLVARSSVARRAPGPPVVLWIDEGGAPALELAADGARFGADARESLLEMLAAGVLSLARAPAAPSRELSFLGEAAERRLAHEWNEPALRPAKEHTVPELFAAAVRRAPDAPAVLSVGRRLTYSELDARSAALAAELAGRGVVPGDVVLVLAARSERLIVALLAILRAGGAYLPLDASWPAERLRFAVSDARPRVVVADPELAAALGPAAPPLVPLEGTRPLPPADAFVAPALDPGAPAYVLYTSGSTGTPKGVVVPHRAIDRLVCHGGHATLGPGVVTLHAAPVAFDASTLEIWGALLTGGAVALHDEPVPTAAGLRAAIARHGVTTLWLTAALFNAVIDTDASALAGLRELLTGGEALSVPHVRRALQALPGVDLLNGYGPTETTTFATAYRIPREPGATDTQIPIGRAIGRTTLFVLDARGRLVPPGGVGELHVGGAGVALGYLGRPELTAERFVPDPYHPGERLYRTGDLVRMRPDRVVEYLGRADQQVKIRGHRIEPGEIEAALVRLPGVRAAAVVARPAPSGELRLLAYVVRDGGSGALDGRALREALAERLPPYMIPAAVTELGELPRTANGKLDQRALPEPAAVRPDLPVPFTAPGSDLERTLARIWAEALGIDRVGIHDPLFELGATSLLVVRTVARIEQELGRPLRVVHVFADPTVAAIAAQLSGSGDDLSRRLDREAARAPRGAGDRDIAIVGMVGRFPGARDVATFWGNLVAGVDSVTHFAEGALDPALDPAVTSAPGYVRARGILPDAELFDAGFFGITPLEAELMDPQQRLLLEVAWETLEDAGHADDTDRLTIGVFAGKYNDSYYQANVLAHPDRIAALGAFQVMVANEKDYVATRLAHRLDLRGPALSIHTACSTSLVAVAEAVKALRDGDADLALAGGVSVTVPVHSGYAYQEGGMLSPDGRTRPFDASAAGTVFSDGVGMVALRRLPDALADGDTIHAVICGVAVNNDGARKASFTAPSVEGQALVVARAQADAGVDPGEISYVEAHGTATPLGDPIEVEALSRVFRRGSPRTSPCALGSVKGNVGHLVIAAGAAGLIKTALALRHRTLPATVHFQSANPRLLLDEVPFRVVARTEAWDSPSGLRVAGVSSFGVGGTNAHVVVQEPPSVPRSPRTRSHELLVVSARTERDLAASCERLAGSLRGRTDAELADVAFTLHAGRRPFAHRRAFVAATTEEAVSALSDAASRGAPRRAGGASPRVAFLFPGQGAQHPSMGAALYREEPLVRELIDHAAARLAPVLGGDLRALLHPEGGDTAGAEAALRETRVAQPALFAVEYALARYWQRLGVVPSVMIGHSVGEFVAAALAGVFSFEEALDLVAARGALMQSLPRGAMLSVRLSAGELEPRLPAGVEIASDNSPSLSVAAGDAESIASLEEALTVAGVPCRRLVTSHAFHTAHMDAAVAPFEARVRAVRLSAPRLPIVSTATGRLLSAEEATDPAYWAAHLRRRVRFTEGVAPLAGDPELVLLEVGPRATLTTLARQQAPRRERAPIVPSLGDTDAATWPTLLRAAGELWSAGVPLDPAALHGPRRARVPLPTYAFDRRRHWVDVPARGGVDAGRGSPATAAAAAPPSLPGPAASSLPDPPRVPTGEQPMPSPAPAEQQHLVQELIRTLEETSGLEVGPSDAETPFVELGLDSLFLTQFALAVQKRFRAKVTFRQLLEQLPTLAALASHVAAAGGGGSAVVAPAEPPAPRAGAAAPPPRSPVPAPVALPVAAPQPSVSLRAAEPGTVQAVIEQQLALMQQQLALLSGGAALPAAAVASRSDGPGVTAAAVGADAEVAGEASPPGPAPAGAAAAPDEAGMARYDVKKAFGAIARITTARADDLTPQQRARLDAFVRRYTTRTRGSKAFAQENRRIMADPRVVTGFRPAVKELVYPIVVERSQGAKLWDIDGNEYVDALNGFGLSLFGWQPEFVTRAIEEQLRRGHEIGPQHPLAAEVARLVCELTGMERAAFCNTGSEAVLGCVRIARTVTGRSKIVMFTGSYHGIFDEVVVRGAKRLRSIPAAPGILPNTAENVLVLEYGSDEALAVIREHRDDIAAVLVEPIQSRRPDFRPRAFLEELRAVTREAGSLLVFDEVVNGFRTGPGGAQEYYGIRADLASYGKVVGGGLPIGIIAGKAPYMDALDGGYWEFGDDSVPPVGVTYFAGTFVRHPLALAAARAVLLHLKERGPALQRELGARTTAFVEGMNAFFREVGVPLELRHFSSFWRTFATAELPHQDLLFYMLRDRGVHIFEGFPCFFTTAHSEADFAHLARAYRESVLELVDGGFFPGRRPEPRAQALDASAPPVPGARLGRDPAGQPAWYVPHPTDAGRYVKYDPS